MGLFDFIYARRNDMSAWAEELQMSFTEVEEYGMVQHLETFNIIDKGRHRKINYLMSGGHELDSFQENIFDFQYTSGNGDSSHTTHTTIIFLNSKNILIPDFYVRPKNKLGKWFARMRNKNQGTDLKEQFLYNYKLEATDKESTLDFLLQSGIPDILLTDKSYSLEGNGHHLLIYVDDKRLDLAQILNMRTTAFSIFDYLKAGSWYV